MDLHGTDKALDYLLGSNKKLNPNLQPCTDATKIEWRDVAVITHTHETK